MVYFVYYIKTWKSPNRRWWKKNNVKKKRQTGFRLNIAHDTHVNSRIYNTHSFNRCGKLNKWEFIKLSSHVCSKIKREKKHNENKIAMANGCHWSFNSTLGIGKPLEFMCHIIRCVLSKCEKRFMLYIHSHISMPIVRVRS